MGGGIFSDGSSAPLIDGFFHRFTGLPGSLLDSAEQFILLSFDVLEIILSEPRPLLFQIAFDDVPVAFDLEGIHDPNL